MKLVKILLSLAFVAALSYSCSESSEQESTMNDSTSVACDSTHTDSSTHCITDAIVIDSTK